MFEIETHIKKKQKQKKTLDTVCLPYCCLIKHIQEKND